VLVRAPSSDDPRENMSGTGLIDQERCRTDHHVSQ
jgi:hypothetical protein